MKQPSLYRVEIAPIVILPLNRSPLFSYLSREATPLGSLVNIPFGRRAIQGIVFGCASFPGQPPYWMKYVAKVVLPAHLTGEQRRLVEEVSEGYLVPFGKTLKHCLPKQAKARKKSDEKAQLIEKLRTSREEAPIARTFEGSSRSASLFLDLSVLSDPKHCLALLIKKVLKEHKQTLILIPEIALIPAFRSSLERFFPSEELAVLHSQLADGPYCEAWERIRSGNAKIVVATRQGLFAPFHCLGAVIIAEEQDESHKQWDMSPRYDARRVAETLADVHGARRLFISETPSIDARHRIASGDMIALAPLSVTPAFGKDLVVVNLRLERFRKNYSPLSETLVMRLRDTLAAGRQAVLYIHRQGMSAFSVCESCKNILRCPQCAKTLTSARDGNFRCLGCGFVTDIFPKCSQCGHLSFRNVGFGTERVEKEVERLFPHAKIFRADGSTMHKPGAAEILYERSVLGKIDILIGTQMVLKDFSLPKPGLIAMIDADSLLSFADFRSDERLYQHLERAVKRVGASNVLIQTFHPESAFFQRLVDNDSAQLSERSMAEREALLYPPFSRLVALSFREVSLKKVGLSIKEAFEALRTACLETGSGIRFVPPTKPTLIPRKKLYESTFFMRIPVSEAMPYEALRLLATRYRQCIIDIDPIAFY